MRFPRLHYNKTAVALCKNHIYFCNVANSSIAKYPCSFCVCSPYAYAKYVAVFAKTPCKTLDVGIITYLLKMASAQQYMPKELVKPKRTLAIYTTPSVSSTDGKTYIQLVKKGASKKAAAPVAASPVGSQIRIEPVQTFLQQEEYDDGTAFTVDGHMTATSNKSKLLVKSAKQLTPSDEQNNLLALHVRQCQ